MKTIIIYTLTVLLSLSAFGQEVQKEKKFMLQNKFRGMYFQASGTKFTASSAFYGNYFFISRGELIREYDPKRENAKIIQLKENRLIVAEAPLLTKAEYDTLRVEMIRGATSTKVNLPKLKSKWYFEAAKESGYYYIVCPYEPYVGFCLTVTNRMDNKYFNVELSPRKPTLNDDQKWKFIWVPYPKK